MTHNHFQFANSQCQLFMICIVLTLTTRLAFWEDFTCLDVSQCLLNKGILQCAVKYLKLDISGCLSQFLALGTKVYMFMCNFHSIFHYICVLVQKHIDQFLNHIGMLWYLIY